MNRKFLTAALAVLAFLPSMAQSDRYYEYDEYGKVGRSEGWARRFAHNFVDGLIGADYYETTDAGTKVIVNNEFNSIEANNGDSKSNVKKNYKHYSPGHTPDFYFGVNLLCTDRPPVMTPGLEQRSGKGFEFGLAVGQWGYHMTRHIALNTAFYVTRSRYRLAEGRYLAYQDNRTQIVSGAFDGRDIEQGYLRYWSLRVPLCLELSSASHRGPFLAFGPEIEYRFGEMSKVRPAGGDRIKVTDNLNINPLGVNAVARIGINNFGIIARYSFTGLFLNDSPIQTYPFMVGLSASF